MKEQKINPHFEGGGDMSSSILEEETSLLFSAAPQRASKNRSQSEFHEPSSLPSSVSFDGQSPASAGPAAPSAFENAAEAAPQALSRSSGAENATSLVERLRGELAFRRGEDAVAPSARRPRLEKKTGRSSTSSGAATPPSIRKKASSIVPERSASSRQPKSVEWKGQTSLGRARRSLLEKVYGVPVFGYCVELLVHFFRLPLELREVHVRATKKETVVQARLDGMGSRVAALREGAALCRREMEAAIAEKAEAESLAVLSVDVSRKVDSERFEAFTLNLEAELSRKAEGRSLQQIALSLESALGELREEISGKAGEERLEALESVLREKADTVFVRSLEARLEDLSERLEGFDGRSALERMAAIESALPLKADLDLLKSILSGKSDTDALEALERRLGEVVAGLMTEVGKKADMARVENLESALPLKADSEDVDSFLSAKADVKGVSALEERLRSLDSKTSELEVAFEARLSSKADAEDVTSLGENLANVTEQLGSLEGKVALDRLESLETSLERKADLEIVKSLLSLKMDVEVLKTLGRELEKASEESRAAVERKADMRSVEALGSSVLMKADSALLQALAEDVSALGARLESLDEKADAADVFSLSERVEFVSGRLGALDLKAEADAVRLLGEQLGALSERMETLDAKADLELVRSLEARMDLKADAEGIESLEERFAAASSVLEKKADAESLSALSREIGERLAAKADVAAVDEALASKAGKDELEGVRSSVVGELGTLQRRLEEHGERANEEERRLLRFREEVQALIASSLERGSRAEMEERFRANFPYVSKVKEHSAAFRELESGAWKRIPGGGRSEQMKTRKRVKR